MEVGVDEVTLRMGKQANKRCIQFVLQALAALFGKLRINDATARIFREVKNNYSIL